MFSEICASKFFEILDAFDLVIVLFGDPKCTERVAEGSDINSKFGKSRIVVILDNVRNAINFNSILINGIDRYKLISKALFISPSGLKGEEGNVEIKRYICDESVYTIKLSDVKFESDY